MNDECPMCKALKEGKNILYEDAVCVAILPENGATLGHIQVFPKQHVHYLERLDDALSNHLFQVASQAAMVVFEAVGAQGTNIILNNGVGKNREHLTLNVIPRKSKDGLDFMWKGKSASMEELEEVKQRLHQHTQYIVAEEAQKTEQPPQPSPQAKEEEEPEQEDTYEDRLLRTLDRIP